MPWLFQKEVKFVGGSVGTNSRFDVNSQPEAAFQKQSNSFWHSGRDAEGKGEGGKIKILADIDIRVLCALRKNLIQANTILIASDN